MSRHRHRKSLSVIGFLGLDRECRLGQAQRDPAATTMRFNAGSRQRLDPAYVAYPASALQIAAAVVCLVALPIASQAQTTLPPVVVEGSSRAVRSVQPSLEPEPTPQRAPARPSANRPAAGTGQAVQPGAEIADGGSAVTSSAAGGTAEPGALLSNQGTATTVITGEELRQQQIRSPVEALRGLPGVTVNRAGGVAGLSQVRKIGRAHV